VRNIGLTELLRHAMAAAKQSPLSFTHKHPDKEQLWREAARMVGAVQTTVPRQAILWERLAEGMILLFPGIAIALLALVVSLFFAGQLNQGIRLIWAAL